jgi:carbon-monoxide dehydrogenase medium subunit
LKPPPFAYFAPTRLEQAVEMLAGADNARLLAGGQSLIPMLSMRYVLPDQLIDLNRVAELNFIRPERDEIVMGSMTRQRALERSELVRSALPIFSKALRYVGHIQTRTRGTFGGSLCQLDPSAELPALAMAYDAIIEATGPNGTRSIAMADFPALYMTPVLEPNEILSAVRIRPWTGRTGVGFREFSRRHGDFAVAGGIALLEGGPDGRIKRASVTAFGIAEAPIRVAEAERMLLDQRPDAGLFTAAAEHCLAKASLDDAYASAAYRGHVAMAMVQRALGEAAQSLAS